MRGAGPDRRAGRDRRARRRRDRQRRPGAPRAARLDRGDRGGQGGADRRRCAPAATAVVPAGRAAARRRTCAADVDDRHLRPGRRRRRRSARRPRRDGARRVSRRAHMRPQRARRARRRARASGSSRGAPSTCASRAARPADRAARTASSSSTTATTPTRCRCAPPSTTSPRPRPGAASPCSATCSSSGRTSRASTSEIGALRAARGVDVLVTVGPLAAAMRRRLRRAARSATSRTPREAARRSSPACSRPATRCSSRARAASASRSSPSAGARTAALMGEVLIARHGLAADLHLPVAEVHRVPARARVRPAHPRGGPGGPPREGRHADDGRDHHLHRDLGPVPDPRPTTTGARSGVFGAAIACALLGFADDYTKIVKRRSLGLRARTKLGVTIAISLGLWWSRTQEAHLADDAAAALRRRQIDLGVLYPVLIYLVRRGHDERGQPHRRARRPRGGLRGDRAARLHRRSRSSRPASTTWRCSPAASSAPASASCGSTRSRRRSSWATPARSGWAARSPASR